MEGLTKSYGGILVARFFLGDYYFQVRVRIILNKLLGFFESGMFPGCLYLVSMLVHRSSASAQLLISSTGGTVVQKRQSALRFSFTRTVYPDPSVVSTSGLLKDVHRPSAGLLGYAIGHMDGVRGLHGWRWIFILGAYISPRILTWSSSNKAAAYTEGILTCLTAFALFFVVSDFPEESNWLSEEEKAFVKARLEADVGNSGRDEKLKLVDVLRPLFDCEPHLEYLVNAVFMNRRQKLPWSADVF